jgi:phage terminase small subunit
LKKSTSKLPADPRLTPPEGLSDAAASWWRRLIDQYAIDDDAGLLLLETAMRAMSRMEGATAAIAQDGATILDRFGQPKPHPLLAAERDARGQMLQALKLLNLSVEPLGAIGRPSGS